MNPYSRKQKADVRQKAFQTGSYHEISGLRQLVTESEVLERH